MANDEAVLCFTFEGQEIPALPGQSVAAALLAAGERELRRDEFGVSKGLFCGIGHCWECRCEIDGVANVRACMTTVKSAMVVRRQEEVG